MSSKVGSPPRSAYIRQESGLASAPEQWDGEDGMGGTDLDLDTRIEGDET